MATTNLTMDGAWQEVGTGLIAFQLRDATTLSLEWLAGAQGLGSSQVAALDLQGLSEPVSAGATSTLVWDFGAEALYVRAKDGTLVVL